LERGENVSDVELHKMIIRMLEGLDKKFDDLNTKVDARFAALKCNDQNLRIDRIEQREQDRKESRALIWTGLFAALSAFGMSMWNWINRQ
jgi:hypothetical protein